MDTQDEEVVEVIQETTETQNAQKGSSQLVTGKVSFDSGNENLEFM